MRLSVISYPVAAVAVAVLADAGCSGTAAGHHTATRGPQLACRYLRQLGVSHDGVNFTPADWQRLTADANTQAGAAVWQAVGKWQSDLQSAGVMNFSLNPSGVELVIGDIAAVQRACAAAGVRLPRL